MIKNILKKCRNIVSLLFCSNKFKKSGKNNKIFYDTSVYFKNTSIKIIGNNNTVTFGKNCRIFGLSILCNGNGNQITINNNVIINASRIQPTVINAIGGTKIFIDDNCLLSNNIEIHTSDYHNIYNKNNFKINENKDINIGKHCWIGLRAIILKGVNISDGSIIGAGTIITKSINDKNVVVVGNPQHIIKKEIHWDY